MLALLLFPWHRLAPLTFFILELPLPSQGRINHCANRANARALRLNVKTLLYCFLW